MPDDDPRQEDQRAAVDQIRKVVAEGFAYVRSREVTRSISAITFEELLSRAVVAIEEDVSDIRPSQLNRIRNLKQAVIDAVDRALELPASAFDLNPADGEANTRIDGTGAGEAEEDE